MRLENFLAVHGTHWDATLAASPRSDPFVTTDWLESWWQHFGSRAAGDVIAPSGERVTAAAFGSVAREWHRGVPLKVWRFLVNAHSRRASAAALQAPRELAQALLERLLSCRGEWDMAKLQGLSAAGGLAQAILSCDAARDLGVRVERQWSDSRMALDGSWEAYYRSLNHKRRHDQERRARRLAERAPCRWRKCRGAAEVGDGLEAYFAIEAGSWKASQGELIRRDPVLESFYRAVAMRFAARGQCEIGLLYCGDTAICGVLSIVYGGRMFTLKSSYLEEYADFSPGSQAFRHLIQDAFERGLAEIDFCGRQSLTTHWSKEAKEFCDLVLFSPTLRGSAAKLAKAALHRVRPWR